MWGLTKDTSKKKKAKEIKIKRTEKRVENCRENSYFIYKKIVMHKFT